MTRRLFIIALWPSLVLSLGTAALWVRSSFLGELWQLRHKDSAIEFMSSAGVVTVTVANKYDFQLTLAGNGGFTETRSPSSIGETWDLAYECWGSPEQPDEPSFGFALRRDMRGTAIGGLSFGAGSGEIESSVRFPYWVAVLLLAIPAAFQAISRRLPCHRLGLTCSHCGYDLRATPARCPECGAVPAEAKP